MLRKAFTLMEVNLAIMVMAGGLLSSVALFSLAYRESSSSNEDVAASAYAEEVLGRLTLALGDTNVTWSAFRNLADNPSGGWRAYFDTSTGEVRSGSEGTAMSVYSTLMGIASGSGIPSGWPQRPDCIGAVGLVATHDENSPVVKIAFRAAAKESKLMSSPLYFIEVLYQGGDQ